MENVEVPLLVAAQIADVAPTELHLHDFVVLRSYCCCWWSVCYLTASCLGALGFPALWDRIPLQMAEHLVEKLLQV